MNDTRYTKHKFVKLTKPGAPVTDSTREQCEICGALRWFIDGVVRIWQPEDMAKYRPDCDAPAGVQDA